MKILKQVVALLLVAVMCLGLWGCRTTKKNDNNNYKLNIVTTLFPYYDMVRAIVGDVEDIHVSMTVAPGQDSHSFEPSPADVIEIEEADLFIYNGGSLEHWVDTLLQSFNNGDHRERIRMMDYVEVLEEEHVEGMDTRFESDEHNHKEEPENHNLKEADGHTQNSTNQNTHSHEGEADEHIWTSPVNVQILTNRICKTLCEIMPENKDTFQMNAKKYISDVKRLDGEFRNIFDKADKKEIIFADKFPILYFAKEYGLDYYAAFPGCGSDMEPSAKTIAFLIDKIKEDNINAVFYLELSSHIVADVISDDTGAEALKFNSCHNITQKQFDAGVTYIDLMKENVLSLKKAFSEK